jgi:septum formation protein
VTDSFAQGKSASPTTLILASASPRRRDILSAAGIDFEIVPADIEELARPSETPTDLAERLAREKALAVAARLSADRRRPVLGSDTIVVLGDLVLGKPRDEGHAVELLSKLMQRSRNAPCDPRRTRRLRRRR